MTFCNRSTVFKIIDIRSSKYGRASLLSPKHTLNSWGFCLSASFDNTWNFYEQKLGEKTNQKHKHINKWFFNFNLFIFFATLPSWLFPAVSLSCYQYQDRPPEPHLLASRQPGKHGQNSKNNNKSIKPITKGLFLHQFCHLKVFSMCLPGVSMQPNNNKYWCDHSGQSVLYKMSM